jgi:hypothetical protein
MCHGNSQLHNLESPPGKIIEYKPRRHLWKFKKYGFVKARMHQWIQAEKIPLEVQKTLFCEGANAIQQNSRNHTLTTSITIGSHMKSKCHQ